MGLINPRQMMENAQREGYAIAAFNIQNLEMIQAVAEAAWEERSPLIIQTTPGTLKHMEIPHVVACTRVVAKMYDIPIALHLDHCESYGLIAQCMQAGYTSVMIDGSKLPFQENVDAVKKVVDLAKILGIAVEGEIGAIAGVEDDLVVSEGDAGLTMPEEARDFAEATNVDTVAVAIGTAHGLYLGEPKLDFKRLTAIAQLVPNPLVLHGASGVSDQDIKGAIKRGICKVNIATELKVAMAEKLQGVFQANPKEIDPRNYMGQAREAVKELAREKIRLCGSSNKAWSGIR